MKNLIEVNIYEPKGKVLVVGSCLSSMQPIAYEKLKREYDMVFSVCLENTHINMIITKIGAMLSTGNITKLSFASVDKSPHCVQLHYIKKEVLRMLDTVDESIITNIIIDNNKMIKISDETINLSKTLSKLEGMLERI